jgi:hypothetical protein
MVAVYAAVIENYPEGETRNAAEAMFAGRKADSAVNARRLPKMTTGLFAQSDHFHKKAPDDSGALSLLEN